MKKAIENIEFYKEQFLFEYERKKFHDRMLQYPTTLIIIFIGGVLYSYKDYFGSNQIGWESNLDRVFIILLMLFAISSSFTIYFLARIFHGMTRRYSFLPTADFIHYHEMTLYKHHYKYGSADSKPAKRIDAQENTCLDLQRILKKYYIEMTAENQKINDKRSTNFFNTRISLFIDLILFIVIGLIAITS